MSADLPREERLGLEWELWVVEQLLAGALEHEVVGALVAEGLDGTRARDAVASLRESPGVARLRRQAARGAMAAQLVTARRDLGPVDAIDRRAAIGVDEFRERYWARSRPLLLTEAARSMRAVQRWSLEHLAARFGDLEVEVNVRREEARRSSDTERFGVMCRFGDYLADIAIAGGNDCYIVSRNGLLDRPELTALWEDLRPLPEVLVPPKPPRGASLWIGPAGTLSPAHFDPHGVLLVQVQGRKRVRLVAPDHLAMFEGLDGYYTSVDLDDPAALPPGAVLTTEIGPGEALFVPLAWFHEVCALEPSITLSMLCFPWGNDFHWMKPVDGSGP